MEKTLKKFYWSIVDLQFVLVSGIQHSDSIRTHIFIILPYRLLQNIESSSLYNIVSPCWLSILYI